ncbi:hypothetical protein C3L33_04964, partial [Rhododendron williamsianum]
MDPMVAKRSSSAPSSRGGIMDTIRAVMMAVVIVVVSGWLFMWVMTPTRVYGQIWLPKIRADTISTFFGTQGYISLIEFVEYKLIKYLYVPGATILLYTFPMLFIAVLGSLYIHLGKNNFSDIAERYVRKTIDHTYS